MNVKGFSSTYRDYFDVVHIVAMPRSENAFTACGRYHRLIAQPLCPVTCIACWAREFIEWEFEAAFAHGHMKRL